MFLNANNEPEFRINNSPKAVVRNNPSLTASDNTIVTMAMLQEFKTNMFNVQFPVGISIITQDPRNPAEYLGFGSWERDLEGRALVGYSSDVTANTPDWKKVVNRTFGSDTHTLTIDEMPKHDHDFSSQQQDNYSSTAVTNTNDIGNRFKTSLTGGDQPHNNVQMSKVKFIWTRIL